MSAVPAVFESVLAQLAPGSETADRGGEGDFPPEESEPREDGKLAPGGVQIAPVVFAPAAAERPPVEDRLSPAVSLDPEYQSASGEADFAQHEPVDELPAAVAGVGRRSGTEPVVPPREPEREVGLAPPKGMPVSAEKSAASPPGAQQEKNAAGEADRHATSRISRRGEGGSDFLYFEDDEVKCNESADGIETAKPAVTMLTRAFISEGQTSFSETLPAAARGETAVAAVSGRGEKGGASSDAAPPETSRLDDTAAVVRKVMAMADDLRARAHNSVELRFELEGELRLTVRIACREREVQTTFESENAGLCEALGREWKVQAVAVASEPRAYRLAEPAITLTGPAEAEGRHAQDGHARERRQAADSFGGRPAVSHEKAGPAATAGAASIAIHALATPAGGHGRLYALA